MGMARRADSHRFVDAPPRGRARRAAPARPELPAEGPERWAAVAWLGPGPPRRRPVSSRFENRQRRIETVHQVLDALRPVGPRATGTDPAPGADGAAA
jgi:hypothetical protein